MLDAILGFCYVQMFKLAVYAEYYEHIQKKELSIYPSMYIQEVCRKSMYFINSLYLRNDTKYLIGIMQWFQAITVKEWRYNCLCYVRRKDSH